jgi:para-nitrobenzyl esterase
VATPLRSADRGCGSFGSEDCLSLNVFRLAQKKNQNKHSGLAVMVWIHGGGFTTGGSALFDPTPLLKKGDVIVVTINYRLGFIGFFAHPALDAEGHLNANYGLMDQQLALGWVRRNIAAFGGDPNRVTIFGESAGGYSVYSNIASPTAAGLFHGAIAESGAIFLFHDYFPSIVPVATAETVGTVFVPAGTAIASSIGCASQTAQCLRATAASTIVEAEPGLLYPIVDGTLLNQTLDSAFASGEINHGPVIFGSNHDEWRFFVALQYDLAGTPLTDPNYLAAVGALIGLPTSDPFIPFLANVAYPLSNYLPQPPGNQSAPLALGAMGTDFVFA